MHCICICGRITNFYNIYRQYTVFLQCMLLTLSSRLGTAATSDVMEAWVNAFAFVCKTMLPLAIDGHVNNTEININTSKSAPEYGSAKHSAKRSTQA
jgi:hypothetical protein